MIRVTAAIIIKENKILLTQRSKEDKLSLKWEFPGGKIEENENEKECLKREILEELELNINVEKFFFKNIHKYNDKEIELNFYICKIISGKLKLNVHNNFKWVNKTEIKNFDLADADIPVVNEIKKRL